MGLLRIALVTLLLAACGGDEVVPTTGPPAEVTTTTSAVPAAPEGDSGECAHVIGATIEPDSSGSYTVSATVKSADTGWDKYADAWEVRGPDGEVLGERVLAHPHENEQPFTRSLSGVEIAAGVGEVTVAAHDSVAGFCGDVFVVEVPAP